MYKVNFITDLAYLFYTTFDRKCVGFCFKVLCPMCNHWQSLWLGYEDACDVTFLSLVLFYSGNLQLFVLQQKIMLTIERKYNVLQYLQRGL